MIQAASSQLNIIALEHVQVAQVLGRIRADSHLLIIVDNPATLLPAAHSSTLRTLPMDLTQQVRHTQVRHTQYTD